MLSKLVSIIALAAVASASLSGRTLSAATRPASLKRRSQAFEFANDVELFYAESTSREGDSNYGATVKVAAKKPILVLEETEDWLSSIECAGDKIVLTKMEFTDSVKLAKCHDLVDGHIITSHPTCNQLHERLAYKVLAVEEISESTVSLKIAQASWKTAFDSISVEMGYTTVTHELRAHQGVRRRKRQDDASATFALSATVPSLTAVPSPTSVDSSAPTATQINLAASAINQPIPLPSGSPIELTCNECSTTGTIDLAWGQWSVEITDSNDDGQYVTGYANITANGVGATVNLGADIKQTWSFLQPVLGNRQTASFRVPGLGGASLAIGPFIAGGYTLNGELKLNQYGFTAKIPDGSTASLDLSGADAVDVYMSGFDNTEVTAIPWNSNIQFNGLSAWLALRWTIQAAFIFQDDEIDSEIDLPEIDAAAAIYLDTPILNMTLSAVQNVGTDCQPSSDSSVTSKLASVVKVDLAAGWDYGAYANAEIPSIDVDLDASTYDRGDNQLALSNADSNLCLNWDGSEYKTAQDTVKGGVHKVAVSWPLTVMVGLVVVLFAFAGL